METDELKNHRVTVNVTMFKQVLKKEFGEIRGVARAKRKPYILVVLSRQEIDLILDHLDEPVDLAARLRMAVGCGCLNV